MIINLKTAIKYVTLFSIGIWVLYLAFRGQDLGNIWLEIKSANYFWVGASALSVWFAHVLRALRWRLLYQAIHYPVSFSNAYHAVIIGYLANLALPRFGEIVRCSIIHKTEKVPMFASIGTVITERLFDVLVLFSTAAAMLVFQYDLVSGFIHNVLVKGISNKLASLSLLGMITLAVVAVLFIASLVYFLRRRFGKKFLRVFVNLRQGFGSYSKLPQKAPFLLYTLAIWIFYFLSMYFAFSSVKATSGLHFNAAFTAIVFSGFAMAAPVQGGIGVFHWVVAQALVLYAISFKDGLAYATIIHSSQLLLILILGSSSLLILFYKNARRFTNTKFK